MVKFRYFIDIHDYMTIIYYIVIYMEMILCQNVFLIVNEPILKSV